MAAITHLSPKGSDIARVAPTAGGGSSIASLDPRSSEGEGAVGGQEHDLFSSGVTLAVLLTLAVGGQENDLVWAVTFTPSSVTLAVWMTLAV